MSQGIELLEDVNKIAAWWKDTQSPDPHTTLEAHRKLTGVLVFLETLRSEYKKKFEKIIFIKTGEGDSVARATNKAETEVSELYLLRRAMYASYEMSGSMRTYISFLKMEKNEI